MSLPICKGKKKDGTQCASHTSYPNGYCLSHQSQAPVPAPAPASATTSTAPVAPATPPTPAITPPAPARSNNIPWIIGGLVLIGLCILLFLGSALIFKPLLLAVVPSTSTPLPTASPLLTPAPGANSLVRRESGQNNTIAFAPGETAYGWRIVLVDGRTCDSGNCFLTSAPVAGTVTSGVVNPWTTEIVGKTDSIFSIPATATPIVIPPTPTAVVFNPTSAVPYNLPPQPQIGHPSLYLETGIPDPFGQSIDAHTKHWVIELLPGTTAIIGGFKVDGVSNGVYKAVAGPGVLDTTVTDGFVAVTINEWANAEFCFRIAQAVQFNWAHQTVLPLPGWTCQ